MPSLTKDICPSIHRPICTGGTRHMWRSWSVNFVLVQEYECTYIVSNRGHPPTCSLFPPNYQFRIVVQHGHLESTVHIRLPPLFSNRITFSGSHTDWSIYWWIPPTRHPPLLSTIWNSSSNTLSQTWSFLWHFWRSWSDKEWTTLSSGPSQAQVSRGSRAIYLLPDDSRDRRYTKAHRQVEAKLEVCSISYDP